MPSLGSGHALQSTLHISRSPVFSVLRGVAHHATVHQSSMSHPTTVPNPASFRQWTEIHPPIPHPSTIPPIKTNPPTMVNPAIASMTQSRRILYADKIMDGVAVSKKILTEIRQEIYDLLSEKAIPQPPQLAIILIGDSPDSVSYVRRKIQACTQVGFRNTRFYQMPSDVDQTEVLNLIQELNQDLVILILKHTLDNSNDCVDGILVQLPLPGQIDSSLIQESILPIKDVDVFHPQNRSNFIDNYNPHAGSISRQQFLVPPTPQACIELLTRYKIPIAGKNVVVIGKSLLVGEPIAILLRKYGANVTSCDETTANIQSVTSKADILISATGKAELVRPSWIKPGCVVLDVGITVTPAPSMPEAPQPTSADPFPIYTATPASAKLQVRGDVAFLEVLPIVSKITPVPGGIGPTTVAALLRNTLIACKNRFSENPLLE